ncbi:MAG: hypothetical protein CME64_08805 [Halobacteriovoraceae bacterium]|nr:hypothetical protein [Halobacteriovoraceae bacterium]|tara:strand:+ start:268 stop:837 length:570 start_codon:yes stop_codon:yes gene_type:complete
MKAIFNLLIILLLNGCSSLSKEDCANQNWFELGRSDAMGGEANPKTSEYANDCSEYGMQIKGKDYIKGFQVGLKKYCTYENGQDLGEDGEAPHPRCEKLNPKFKKGYSVGLEKFKREQLRSELIEDNGGRECSFSSDCMYEGSCLSGKCERSDSECSSDSDCEYEGGCDSVSAWTDFNDHVSVNVCRPD